MQIRTTVCQDLTRPICQVHMLHGVAVNLQWCGVLTLTSHMIQKSNAYGSRRSTDKFFLRPWIDCDPDLYFKFCEQVVIVTKLYWPSRYFQKPGQCLVTVTLSEALSSRRACRLRVYGHRPRTPHVAPQPVYRLYSKRMHQSTEMSNLHCSPCQVINSNGST